MLLAVATAQLEMAALNSEMRQGSAYFVPLAGRKDMNLAARLTSLAPE